MTKFVNRRLPPAGVTIKGCGENLTLACEIHATLTDSAVPVYIQGSAKRHRPGCKNAAGKFRQKW